MSIDVIVSRPTTGYGHQSAVDVAKALSKLRHRGREESLFFEMKRRRFFLNTKKDKKLRAQVNHKEKKFRKQNRHPCQGGGFVP